MSPNGTLLAYSKPVDIKELRDQAALISIVWKDHCTGRQKIAARAEPAADSSLKPPLKTLTVETEDCNILIRHLQPELLLVLVGKIAPKKKQIFKITPESYGEPRYPDIENALSRPSSRLELGDAAADSYATRDSLHAKGKAPSLLSNMSQRDRDVRVGALHVQRKRLDALADYVLKDFDATGFVMPADSDLQ